MCLSCDCENVYYILCKYRSSETCSNIATAIVLRFTNFPSFRPYWEIYYSCINNRLSDDSSPGGPPPQTPPPFPIVAFFVPTYRTVLLFFLAYWRFMTKLLINTRERPSLDTLVKVQGIVHVYIQIYLNVYM